jgi:muramoyltetrapeptide carboxypeptidase
MDAVQEFDYPVCFGFPAGHDKKNLALAFGLNWELEVLEKNATLQIRN